MALQWLLAAGMLLALGGSSFAQSWPTRPIRAVVPFTAGSATDIIARTVCEVLAQQLGQPVVVENRTGAGGTTGTAAVAKADPDGYTILIHSSSHTITPSTYSNLSYDTANDLSGVIPLANLPSALVVSPAKFKSVGELVAAAKAKPDSLNYASGGAGGASHLNAERFLLSAGIKVQHVPFRGAPEALTEVMAGRVDFYFSPVLPALSLIQDNKLAALAVSTLKRSSALPQVPTTLEAGYANSDYNFWVGVFIPRATPREIVDKVHQAAAKVLDMPAVREKLAKLGADPMPMTPQEFDAYVQKEIGTNAALVKAAGIKVN
jgi:tripartite-type tricarboxylate transporter receptor subunit TctC